MCSMMSAKDQELDGSEARTRERSVLGTLKITSGDEEQRRFVMDMHRGDGASCERCEARHQTLTSRASACARLRRLE